MSDTVETPTQSIIRRAVKTATITDDLGRSISLKMLNPIDRMQLIAAAGATNSQNSAWMEYAMLAGMVQSIDGVPQMRARNERDIMASVSELGDEGLSAVIIGIAKMSADDTDAPSTP